MSFLLRIEFGDGAEFEFCVAVGGGAFAHRLYGGFAEALAERGVVPESLDFAREGWRIAGFDEDAVFAIHEVVHRAGGACGDDGFAHGHGFEHDDLAGCAFGVQEGQRDESAAAQFFEVSGARDFGEDLDVGRDFQSLEVVATANYRRWKFRELANGVEECRVVAEGAAGGEDVAVVGWFPLWVGDVGVEGDVADVRGVESVAAGDGVDFGGAVGEQADGAAGDKAVEAVFQMPRGGGAGGVNEDLAHDLLRAAEG